MKAIVTNYFALHLFLATSYIFLFLMKKASFSPILPLPYHPFLYLFFSPCVVISRCTGHRTPVLPRLPDEADDGGLRRPKTHVSFRLALARGQTLHALANLQKWLEDGQQTHG